MEIEKKFLVKQMPENLEKYDSVQIEQAYLNQKPVIRIRKWGEEYLLTYKSRKEEEKDVCVNQEVELPLTREAYEHLKEKADGCIVEKTRYRIAYMDYTIELDVFHGRYEGMVLAEVEFPSTEAARCFVPPEWFDKNVSDDYHYANVYLATGR